MADLELTEVLLAKIAGWEVVKQARTVLAAGRVLSSAWTPPLLKGVVQEGTSFYRASLVIKDVVHVENLCTCRQAREWGTICVHGVAVGLHHLQRGAAASDADSASSSAAPGASRSSRPASPQSSSKGTSLRFGADKNDGTPLELFFLLPPQLEGALEKGRIMLCVEAKTPRGRSPLNALSPGAVYKTSRQDQALLERLLTWSDGVLPAMMQLDRSQFAELLDLLPQHPGATLGRQQSLEVVSDPISFDIRASLEADGQLAFQRRGAGALPLIVESEKDSCWVYANARFAPLRLPRRYRAALKGRLQIPRSEVPMVLSRDWPGLLAGGVQAENFKVEDFRVATKPPKFSLHLMGGLAQLQAQLQATYGVRILTLGVTQSSVDPWMPDPDNIKQYWTRDLSAEQGAVARLVRYGFSGPDDQGRYSLVGQNAVLNFFAREFPKLQKEWAVTMEERLDRSCAQNMERVEPEFSVMSSGTQWFEFSLTYRTSSGEALSAAEVQRLLLSGQGHARMKNGKFATFDADQLQEIQETLRDCDPEQLQAGQKLRVAATQAGFLGTTLQEQGVPIRAPNDWVRQLQEHSGERLPDCPPLGDLESVLRPYQRKGVAWMRFLRSHLFGGILADEMGLGKTLQTLAYLRWTKEQDSASSPSLVVCPTSLVFNWVAEAKKFTPSLKVISLHGADRHKQMPSVAEADLVVTSYALMRRDAEKYREWEFDTVVLDEAQHIKNRQTQNAQAVKAVRSRHRLVLTGTPIENSVFDLWSIFDFLMPGYLGSAKDFRDRYELPIAKEKDAGVAQRLSRRLKPFLLRRLKREVAQDLPEKIEQVAFCDLSDPQRQLYQQVLEAGRKEMLDAAGKEGMARGRMVVLTTLLRLRQICCDPRLLPLDPSQTQERPMSSGKTELFTELLQEVLDGGHRALVFSQFTEMLSLLRKALEDEGIEYCYLDGSTQNRGAVVESFQKGEVPVFLISLKAGGVGLNLTAADTVIHFDPWWNPAVEDQATDRAHRLGQQRVVTRYKLIARDTVEEKILLLQQRKRELTQQMLENESTFSDALSWDEIQSLLS